MEQQKKIVILEGPSGIGKDAIIKELIARFGDKIQKFTSYTTRARRKDEIDGQHYHFVDTKTFKQKLKSGDIFEYTTRHRTYRGMSKALINQILDTGKIAIKDCDFIGIKALKAAYPNKVFTIFVTADKNTVRERLKKRGDIDIDTRLRDYDKIHMHIKDFDRIVVNDESIDAVVKKIQNIIGL